MVTSFDSHSIIKDGHLKIPKSGPPLVGIKDSYNRAIPLHNYIYESSLEYNIRFGIT
jgi:hypothetical protein